MLDGPGFKELLPLVTHAIPQITTILVKVNNRILQEEAAIALERTAELIPDAYFQEPLFSEVVPSLTNAIRSHPKVLNNFK